MNAEQIDTTHALEHVMQGGVIRIEQDADAMPLHFRGKAFYVWLRGETLGSVMMPPYSVRVWTVALGKTPISYGLYDTPEDARERIEDYLKAGTVTLCGYAALTDSDTIRAIRES